MIADAPNTSASVTVIPKPPASIHMATKLTNIAAHELNNARSKRWGWLAQSFNESEKRACVERKNADIRDVQPERKPPKSILDSKNEPMRGTLNGRATNIPITPTNLSTRTDAAPATLSSVFCKTPAILITSPPTMLGKKFDTNKPENSNFNISK